MQGMRWGVFAIALSVALGAPVARADDSVEPAPNVKTVVMDLRALRDVDPALATTLTNALVVELGQDDKRTVYGRADLEAALNFKADQQMLGCDESGCFAEIASAMDADTIFTGTIDRLGETYLVTLTELNAQTARPIARAQGSAPLDEAQLLALVQKLLEEIVEKSRGQVTLYGTLEVRTVPTGLVVREGDTELGTTPLVVNVPIGAHPLAVGNASAGTVKFDAVVKRKKTTTADVRLRESPPPLAADVAAYESEVAWGPWLLAAKLLGGFPLCVCFCFPSIFGALAAIQFSTYLSDPAYASSGWLGIAGWGGLALVSAIASLAGVGLVGWGVADIFTDVEPPAGGAMRHRVVITGPDGEETLTFPVDDAMAH